MDTGFELQEAIDRHPLFGGSLVALIPRIALRWQLWNRPPRLVSSGRENPRLNVLQNLAIGRLNKRAKWMCQLAMSIDAMSARFHALEYYYILCEKVGTFEEWILGRV